MKKMLLIGIQIFTVFLLMGCAQHPIQTATPPHKSKVAKKVFVTGSAGSLQRLTVGGPQEYVANLSPDMRWLLITVVDSDKNNVIYKINLQTQSKVIMTPKHSKNKAGEWLPNMSGIIFSTNRMGNYVIVQSLGISGEVGIRYITSASLGNARFPDVSSNGQNIAFSIMSSQDDNEIAIVNSDGTNLRVFGSGWSPQFSTDDTRICFLRKVANNVHIYTMDSSSGSNLIQLTTGESKNYSPSWSPDGTKIAFTSNCTGQRRHIFVVDRNGQNLLQLTDGNFDVMCSKWGKDGYIYFSSNAGDNWDIWRLKLK